MDFTKTIIPPPLMASESIAHSIDSEPIRARGIIAKYSPPLLGIVVYYSHVQMCNLSSGSIDEVEQMVHMTWVQPRVLDLTQVNILTLHFNHTHGCIYKK